MITFIKSQASSITATAVDFIFTAFLVGCLGWWYLYGSILGTISGGIANFYLNRNWTFNAQMKAIRLQLLKYLLVWTVNLLMVSFFVYLLTRFCNVNYLHAKIAVSVFMGLSYNYYMQRHFIFPLK